MSEPRRISRASFWIGAKKVGTAQGGTYKGAGNDEDHLTDEGWSPSDGTVTTQLDIDTITTVDGDTDSINDAILSKTNLTVQISPIDGKTHSVKMRAWDWSYKIDNKSGSLIGTFTFHGGAPTKTG